ncbi:MAG: hypothetical protein ACRYG7_46295 [Janthinobacterium lividum]
MALTPLPAFPKLICMPLIAPSVSGSYAGVPAISATDNGDLGLQFVLDQATDKTVYAVCNGTVRWIPAGQLLPSGAVAIVASVQLAVSADMVQELSEHQPDGLPTLTNFVYQGLDLSTFRAVVTAKVASLPMEVLDADWFKTHASDPFFQSLADKQASFVDNVLKGESTVEVAGGDHLGQVHADANNTSAYPLKIRAYEGDLLDDPNLLGSKINQVVAASPLYFIRYLPEIAQSTVWVGHPLLAATSAFERGAKFYVGFQVSDITTGPRNPNRRNPEPNGPYILDLRYATYVGVQAGSQVHLYDYNDPSTPVATATTNTNGIAYFELTPTQVTGNADFYFVIEAPTTALVALGETQPIQLPATWATATDGTQYWLATDGHTKGYLANFKGFQLGNAVTPVWFNIGVDYFFEFSFTMPDYRNNSVSTQIGLLPQDLKVALISSGGTRLDHTIDDKSAVYGLNFELKRDEELTFEIPLELINPAIGLKLTRTISVKQIPADNLTLTPFITEYWRSKQNPDFLIYTTVASSSLRTEQAINTTNSGIRIDDAFACESLACLTYSRELAVFLHYMTDGEYQGTEVNLKLYHITEGLIKTFLPFVPAVPAAAAAVVVAQMLDLTALSFPLHSIYLTEQAENRRRELIVHESSHQVMYNVSAFDSFDILQRFIDQVKDTGAFHNVDLQSSIFLTLTEGWAEAIGGIFCGYPTDYCWDRNKHYALYIPANIPKTDQDGFRSPMAAHSSKWYDELTWLRDRSNVESPQLTWYSLDPAPASLGTSATRLNRGEESEGSFATAMYSIFWDFVVGPSLYQGLRYILPDRTGDPTRTNSWMSQANQPAISRRFKALFWKPLQDLATEDAWDKKTSARFLRSLAEHATALPTSELNWSNVRARLLLWNMGLPHPDETLNQFAWPQLNSLPTSVQRGSLVGGNTVSYAGQGFVAPYVYTAQRLPGIPFRKVYMKLYVGDQEAANLVVDSPTHLSFTAPAAASPGPVRVTLQLWVRDVLVWEDYIENHYVYA